MNNSLAPLYQLSGSFGAGFTRVDLDPKQRAGLLTQAGVLSQYAVANDPDSIHRGVFVNQRILCVTLPPPDPKAHPLIDLQPNMTNRQRVEATTGKGTCGESCHGTWINTAGFAFEEYDAIGKYRTTDRGQPVDSSDAYPFVPEGLRGLQRRDRILESDLREHAGAHLLHPELDDLYQRTRGGAGRAAAG